MKGFGTLHRNRPILQSVFGLSWFWFISGGLLKLVPAFHQSGFLFSLYFVGVGFGLILCKPLSFGRLELGLVPIGSLGMTIALFILAFTSHSSIWRNAIGILTLALSSGLYILPLYTFVKKRSFSADRSRIIAITILLNSLFLLISFWTVHAFFNRSLTASQIFAVLALMNMAVAIFIYYEVPEFTLRFFAWILVHLLYRARIRHAENVPITGPAVLVCNHVSFIDWLIIGGLVQRPIRFVMHHAFFNIPIARYLFRHAKVIPIASKKESEKVFHDAFEQVSAELRAGELVCIFPEGMITRDGNLNPFRRGIEWIIERDAVPVVPLALRGLWGSLFSFRDGGPLQKLPRRFWYRVDLVCGPPVSPQDVNASRLEASVQSLLLVDSSP